MNEQEKRKALEAYCEHYCLDITEADRFPESRVAWLAAWEARGRASGQQVGEELAAIGKLIATQDNRATDQPLFIVQQKRRVYGIDPDYGGEVVWLHCDGFEADEKEFVQLEAAHDNGDDDPENWTRISFHDYWEFVTACFTEQGCKDYIARDGHNLNEPRIYAAGSYRNSEFRAIRNWLLSLAAGAPAEGRWISVNEGLPELTSFMPEGSPHVLAAHKRIIVATKEGRVFETIRTSLGFANLNSRTDEVTHWMPLPEAPTPPGGT